MNSATGVKSHKIQVSHRNIEGGDIYLFLAYLSELPQVISALRFKKQTGIRQRSGKERVIPAEGKDA